METKVEQLIKDRSYGSLSHEELQTVQEWCASEQEFQQMKLLLQETTLLASAMAIDPSPDIKKSLDAVFSAKHPGAHTGWSAQQAAAPAPAPVIPLYRKTWFRVAAMAVLFLGTIPFWQLADNEMKPQNRPQIAKLEAQKSAEADTQSSPSAVSDEAKPTVQTGESPAATSEALAEVEAIHAPSVSAPVGYVTSDDAVAVSEPAVTFSAGTYRAPQPAFDSGADVTVSDKAGVTLSSIGKKADLDPYSNMASRSESRAISLAQQPNELLDLLVPAF